MSSVPIVVVLIVAAFGVGYWTGWNRAAHPGKVEGEASSFWAKILAAFKRKP